jgi:hypothetical protein
MKHGHSSGMHQILHRCAQKRPPHAHAHALDPPPNTSNTDYRKEMGEPESGTVVTMHVLVRPALAGKGGHKDYADSDAKKAKSGCACVIS